MTDARIGRVSANVGIEGAPDARIGRASALVALEQDGAETQLGRASVNVGIEGAPDARIGRMAVLVGIGPPTPSGVVHGHRTGMALRRR